MFRFALQRIGYRFFLFIRDGYNIRYLHFRIFNFWWSLSLYNLYEIFVFQNSWFFHPRRFLIFLFVSKLSISSFLSSARHVHECAIATTNYRLSMTGQDESEASQTARILVWLGSLMYLPLSIEIDWYSIDHRGHFISLICYRLKSTSSHLM